jgi:hypothetical protein
MREGRLYIVYMEREREREEGNWVAFLGPSRIYSHRREF